MSEIEDKWQPQPGHIEVSYTSCGGIRLHVRVAELWEERGPEEHEAMLRHLVEGVTERLMAEIFRPEVNR